MVESDRRMSRRNFLQAVGALLTASVLPDWIKEVPPTEFVSVKELLELLQESNELLMAADYQGWREDLIECTDFDEALNLAYSFLISSGVDAFEFFVERGWFVADEGPGAGDGEID